MFADPATGRTLRQMTTHRSILHHPCYHLPAYDDRMQWLVFVSHRTGRPHIFLHIFLEDRQSAALAQPTDRDDLNDWSIHPSRDGGWVYFMAGSGCWRVATATLFTAECLPHVGDVPMIPPGMVGDAMGTASLSTDDRWWIVPVKLGAIARRHAIDTASGRVEVVIERPSTGHPRVPPDDPSLSRFVGRDTERIHVVRRDGSGHRLAYGRDVARREWIVHEMRMPRAAGGPQRARHRRVAGIDWCCDRGRIQR